MKNESLIEKLEIFKSGLIAVATDGSFDDSEYKELREEIIKSPLLKGSIPMPFKICRTPLEFRRNTQAQYGTYAERRKYISEEINKLINIIEEGADTPFVNSSALNIQDNLGNGGFGEVYLYHHDVLDMDFAIKFFSPLFVLEEEQEEAEKRFFREAKILFELHSDNIVQIYDAGYIDGKPFIRMEYIDGFNIDKFLEKYSLIPFDKSLKIMIDILNGLEYAHNKGVIHRDLKPSNIMFSKTHKKFKIIDFGISAFMDTENHTKLTKTGEKVAGGAYIDPQLQLKPKLRDARSDIYSVGAVWYYILTGRVPAGSNIKENLINISKINEEYANVVLKCLSYELEERYDDCNQLKEILINIRSRYKK